MDQSTTSQADESSQAHWKKRCRSSEEAEHHGNSCSSLSGQTDGHDGQKEKGSDAVAHRRQQRRLSSDNDVSILRDRKIKHLRLEAIFHSKFENESSEKDVRKEMMEKVEKGDGYLEVTLKHSGSLLLWSGGNRFYSKNDTNNTVTLVGEFLLRKHMSVVWGEGRNKYQECSDYAQQYRLTLSFEVVTAVLGDHGDIPKQPYLVLLSVADRNSQQFYTSHQLIEFAQRFRLPHNDYWIFRTQSSCGKLFQFYDDIREIGTADSVIKGLDRLMECTADSGTARARRIVSMYPHSECQGNILEGLVVRFVEYADGIDLHESLNELVSTSESNLAIMTDAKTDAAEAMPKSINDFFTSESLRQDADLESKLRSNLKNSQRIVRATGTERSGEWEASSIIVSSIESDAMLDDESRQIIQLIQTLKDLGAKVEYKLYAEDTQQEENAAVAPPATSFQRWICIIHVIHDEIFKKYYHSTTSTNAMQLFRGFSFELVFDDQTQQIEVQRLSTGTSHCESPLMLKMKFLPYMVRTFGCRNGLPILSRSGIDGYEHYTLDLLKKWGISHGSIKKWQPYFYSWGLYAESILRQQKQINAIDHQQLNANTYLKHLSDFDKQYFSGQLAHTSSGKSKIRGLVIVLGLTNEDTSLLGGFLASKLGIHTCFNKTASMTEVEMISSICGNAVLCNTTVMDSQAPIKKLIKNEQYSNAVYVVLIGCSQFNIDCQFEVGSKEHKKASGIVKAWGRLRCREVFHLTRMTSLEHDENKQAEQVVDRLLELSHPDTDHKSIPGLLIYFPSIPGAGKSSLCKQGSGVIESGINESIAKRKDQAKRSVITCEGDTVKEKYWHRVLLEKLKHPTSIYLADKNAAPNVWGTIQNICVKSHAVSVSVLPDSMALSTVKVKHSDRECCYPYSLAYLAVCMLRVLTRPKMTHAGKLDESTDHAMLVVVMFYSLYRGISAESMTGTGGAVIIPFFDETKFQELPQDLHDGLVDALHFQYSVDQKNLGVISSEEAENSMEARLRRLIYKHQNFLESICAVESESVVSFTEQLLQIASTLTESKQIDIDQRECHKFIEIASIDIDKPYIDDILQVAAKDYIEIKRFLERVDSSNEETDGGASVEKPHITMAHFSQSSQQNILKDYSAVVGHDVTVSITGILIGETIAALSVKLPEFLDGMESCRTPACHNTFPHVTVWVGKDDSAARSNELPSMVEMGNATEVELAQSINVPGSFSFWYI